MSCNKCKHTGHKCTCHKATKCVEKNCSCAVRIGSDCWTYTGDDLECSGIKKDTIGTEAIQQLDAFICDKFDEVQKFFTIKNVGTGANSYKGISLLGEKELRSITKTGDLITVTQNTNDINISIDEQGLTDFIEDLLPPDSNSTYSVSNLSTGAKVYKDTTTAGNNTQFNLRSILQSGDLVTVTEGTNDITISIDEDKLEDFVEALIPTPTTDSTYSVSNLSDGAQIYKDSTTSGANTQFNIRSLKSSTLTVTQNTNDITIEAPAQTKANVLETNSTSAAFIQNKNPTKTVTLGTGGNYDVVDADNNYVIEIDNSSNNVTIDFSNITITNNFFVGFVQKGTGSVTFVGYDIKPVDFTDVLYGQGHVAAVEVISSTIYLFGTLVKEP